MRFYPLAIVTGLNLLCPVLVFQVPLNGLFESFFKADAWCPVQFGFDFAEIDSVSPIMPRAVFDELDEGSARDF